jgi:predicted TIM-barrel fold metal-dependent hydrolase
VFFLVPCCVIPCPSIRSSYNRIMIIDVHTHIYPNHRAAQMLDAVKERAGVQAYTDGTIEGLLRSMQEAGIESVVVSSIATRPEQVEAMNQWLMEMCHTPVHRLATVHPDLPAAPELVSAVKAQGFKGFKVHPDYQDFFVDEQRIFPLYESAQAEGMPILFHVGVDPGLPHPVHATPQRLARVLKEFPQLRIIAAHMGGQDMYAEAEEHLLGNDIYLDTSFVLRKIPMDILQRFFTKHPIDRFLFGTDSPWTDQREELEFFLSLTFLTQDAKDKIIGTNAAHVLGI